MSPFIGKADGKSLVQITGELNCVIEVEFKLSETTQNSVADLDSDEDLSPSKRA